MSFLHQHNEVCQSSSLPSELMGNKAVDFHKQITLLNFNKFQFNKINNALNRFSTNAFAKWNDVSDVQSLNKNANRL